MNRVIVGISILVVASMLGWLLFRDIPFDRQAALNSTLVDLAAVVFAILGIWIAVLDPSVLLQQTPADKINGRTSLAIDLIPFLISATGVLVAVILLQLASAAIPESLTKNPWILTVNGTIISFLYLYEAWILVGTLLPVARLQRKLRRDEMLRRLL